MGLRKERPETVEAAAGGVEEFGEGRLGSWKDSGPGAAWGIGRFQLAGTGPVDTDEAIHHGRREQDEGRQRQDPHHAKIGKVVGVVIGGGRSETDGDLPADRGVDEIGLRGAIDVVGSLEGGGDGIEAGHGVEGGAVVTDTGAGSEESKVMGYGRVQSGEAKGGEDVGEATEGLGIAEKGNRWWHPQGTGWRRWCRWYWPH